VALPKKLEAGNYALEILLGGLEVPSPAILVEPCTNTIAYDLGILQAAGNTIWLEELAYTLTNPSESIELPVV